MLQQLALLRLCRDLGAALSGELRELPSVDAFVISIEAEVDRHLGGTFAEGRRWSELIEIEMALSSAEHIAAIT